MLREMSALNNSAFMKLHRWNSRAFLLGSLSAAALLTPLSHANAQSAQSPAASDAATGVPDIVVTARRTNERLQDVPIAITALGGQTLKERSVLKVEDLPRVAAGFNSSPGSRGGSNPSYAIRGLKGQPAQTLLLDPAVGAYFAEFNLSRGTGTNQSLFDLQSVQILRGPQGTLFGRNSTGGAVLFEPNRPTSEFDAYVEAGIGDYGMRDIEGMINVPISETLAARFSGKYTKRDGYAHDVINDRDLYGTNAVSGRAILQWKPSNGIKSEFIGTYYRGHATDSAFKVYKFDPRGISSDFGIVRDNVIDALTAELAATQQLGKFELRRPPGFGGKLLDKAWSIQNNSTIDIGEVGFLGEITLKNIIGYRKVNNDYPFTNFTGGAIDMFHHENGGLEAEQWSEEFQIQGKSGNFSYVAGLFYFNEEGDDGASSVNSGYLATPQFLATATPAEVAFASTRYPTVGYSLNHVRNQSYAAYAHATYEIVPGLSLAGGARITKDKRAVVSRNVNYRGYAPTSFTCEATGQVLTSFDPNACALPLSISYTKPTYDVSLSYKINSDVMVYGSFNHGYRAGGFANRISASFPAGNSFDPEYADSFEAGAKSSFSVAGMKGNFNLALFKEKLKGLQRQTFININQITRSVVNNATSMKMWGGEMEFSIRPTSRVNLFANYAFIRPKYSQYNDIQTINGQQFVIDISDSRLGFVPYNQYNAGISWDLPVSEKAGEITVAFNMSGQGKVMPTDISTSNCGPTGTYLNCLNRLTELDGYTLFDARVDWRNVASLGFDLSAFVTNIGNKFYRTYAGSQLPTNGVAAATFGPPRMYGLSVRVPFGASAY